MEPLYLTRTNKQQDIFSGHLLFVNQNYLKCNILVNEAW